MGCGTSKVVPEASKKGYVSVVQSLVAFSRAQEDKDGPKKKIEKKKCFWFSSNKKNLQQPSEVQQQTNRDTGQQTKAAKYKDKFDPRVTAR